MCPIPPLLEGIVLLHRRRGCEGAAMAWACYGMLIVAVGAILALLAWTHGALVPFLDAAAPAAL